jgi:hypothetical protein
MKHILSILSILILILLCILGIYIYKTYRATLYAFSNTIFCGKTGCPLEYEPIEVIPVITNDYSNDIAKYNAQLIINLDNEIHNKHKLETIKGLDLIKSIMYDGKIFALIYKDQNKNNVWIVFRQTNTKNDIFKDLTAYQHNYIRTKNIDQSRLFDSEDAPKIHTGFLTIYETIRTEIITTLNTIYPDNIMITGISLGGAIACLCGIDLYFYYKTIEDNTQDIKKYQPNIIIYTFAAPKVGDEKFSQLFNDNKGRVTLYSLINKADIIPNSPPSVTPNFYDYKNPYFYSSVGISKYADIQRNSLYENHIMPTYVYGLKNNLFI